MTSLEHLPEKRQRSQRLYSAGRFCEASQLVRECLTIDRNDSRMIELQGMILFQQGDFRNSVRRLETASADVPLTSHAQVCLAHGYAQIGKRDLSRDLLLAISDHPDVSTEVLLQVARGLDCLNQPLHAIRCCQRAARRTPESGQVWYDLGFYIGRCGGEESEVEDLARKAISLAPDCTRFRIGLSSFLARQKRHAEAYTVIAQLTKAQIESVCCGSCLQRVVEVYQRAHDYRRLVIAQQQLALLPPGSETCGN